MNFAQVARKSVTLGFSLLSVAAFAAVMPLSLSLPAFAAETMASAESLVGKKAPEFELKDINGKSHKLADFKGKIVVLEWFNDGCPFVKKHYTSDNMQKLQREFTGRGVVWLSINSSAEGKQGAHTPEEYKKVLSEWKAAPTALLLDREGHVGRMYGAKTTPDMYIINKEGVLVYQGAIDSKPSADPADIASSKNYVKEALDQLMEGKKVTVASEKSYGCSVKYAD